MRNSLILTFALIGLLFSTPNASAQRFSFEYWHEGSLILLDGTRKSGRIKYDFQQDIIQYESSRKEVSPYSALNLLYFEIDDEYLKVKRRFYSLPYNPVNGYETPRLFEVIVEGRINLLAREEIEVNNRNYGYGIYRLPDQNDLVLSYYILKEGSKIAPFGGKKSELMSYMGGYSQNVQKHMKEKRLSVKNKKELARIITYYNILTANK